MKKYYSLIILITLLTTVTFAVIMDFDNQRISRHPGVSGLMLSDGASHDRIYVIGNEFFTNAGFTGTGIPGDPYTLSDVNITSIVECIVVQHTNAYVVFEDSSFTSLDDKNNVINFVNVSNCIFRNCIIKQGNDGINAVSCMNVSLVDCKITNVDDDGLDLKDCSDVTLYNTTVSESNRPIYQVDTNRTTIDRSYFFDTNIGSMMSGENMTITNCTFSGPSSMTLSSSHGIFRDNLCFDTTSYLSAPGSANFSVSSNTFISCGYGISISSETNFIITNNTFYDCSIGIFFQNDPRLCTIVNNTFYRNEYSIALSTFGSHASGGPNDIFHNTIGWNTKNARNTAGLISNWDDGVRGNSWSRYSGTGVHIIDGGQGDVDNYPDMLVDAIDPVIESSGTIQFAEGTTGNFARWNISDAFPYSYILDIDGVMEYHIIRDEYVILNLDHLGIGSHDIEIYVYDAPGNSANDSILVNVYDNTSPIIDSPADFSIAESSSGNLLTWEVFDNHPELFTIYVDGVIVASEEWSGPEISYSLNSFVRGEYNLTLVIEDSSGLTATDTVIIAVVDETSPNIEPLGMLSFVESEPVFVYWQASDMNPYWVNVYQNGTQVLNSTWDGEGVGIYLGFVDSSTYNLTIQLTDLDGNSAVDSVLILVYSTESTETTSTTGTTTTETDTDTGQYVDVSNYQQFASLMSGVMTIVVGLAAVSIVLNIVLFRSVRSEG